MSHGDTEDEAIASLREARELYIASLIEDDLNVPEPAVPLAETVPVSDGAELPQRLLPRELAHKSRRR
jgi:predicted RNase H-like HicB family nuclease